MTIEKTRWVTVLEEHELEAGDVTGIVCGNRQIAIYDLPDGLYATSGLCTHAGARLCDGYLDGYVIECPLHQGGFDIRSGKALYAPVTRGLRTYPVRCVEGKVQLLL
ncbi:MAG: non-heme iron oxygenase ferredoxin subunit [Granulosicoccus sp.]|nr:non-heme iron oxygenase ferredoxin subunit [Granulosicoccus sp.]